MGRQGTTRRVLACTTVADAQRERATFNRYATLAAMPETSWLKKTIDTWWPAIAAFIRTRATNAKTEAANVTVKNIKRTGCGYRSPRTTDAASCSGNAARTAA